MIVRRGYVPSLSSLPTGQALPFRAKLDLPKIHPQLIVPKAATV
jgi:hypothetical protein